MYRAEDSLSTFCFLFETKTLIGQELPTLSSQLINRLPGLCLLSTPISSPLRLQVCASCKDLVEDPGTLSLLMF